MARGKFKPSGLNSLENNVIVVEILDAARESARTGQDHYSFQMNNVPRNYSTSRGQPGPRANLADLPDPLVGTWSLSRTLARQHLSRCIPPFGAIGWTAQMNEGGWPYQYFRETIQGFLATHQPSAWMGNYGPFSLMPITGELEVSPGVRASHFNTKTNRLIRTSTACCWTRTGEGGNGALAARWRVPFHLAKNGGRLRGAGRFSRRRRSADSSRDQHHHRQEFLRSTQQPGFAQYFFLALRPQVHAPGTWEIPENPQGRAIQGQPTLPSPPTRPAAKAIMWALMWAFRHEGRRNGDGAHRRFADQRGAGRAQSAAEMPEPGFDPVVARAKAAWERELAKVEVQGGTAAARKTFYTAMYHAVQPRRRRRVKPARKGSTCAR